MELAGLNPDQFGLSLLPTDTVSAPQVVELVGTEGIIWAESQLDADEHVRAIVHTVERSSSEMLSSFIRIRDASDIQKFALRYGPLRICKHGLPATHNPKRIEHVWAVGKRRFKRNPWCEPVRVKGTGDLQERLSVIFYREKVTDWLRFVRSAQSLLGIGRAVRSNGLGDWTDWETLMREWLRWPDYEGFIASILDDRYLDDPLELPRMIVEYAVNQWIRMGQAYPSLIWNLDQIKPSFHLQENTFGQLGVQLATTLALGKQIAFCDGCGFPYLAEGLKPRADRANYCADCQVRRVPDRERKRRFRAAHPNYDRQYRARRTLAKGETRE